MKHPRFHIFDKPRSFELGSGRNHICLGGFPNIRHDIQGAFETALDESGLRRSEAKVKILCLHQSIEGAIVGQHAYRFHPEKDVISLSQFPNDLDLVLSGHIHGAQELRATGGTPILYSGSIERTSFQEQHEVKGYFEIHIREGKLSRRFRTLPTRPMFSIQIPVDLREEDDIEAYILDEASSLETDGIVRVRFTTLEQLSQLSTARIRDLLPNTMNIEVSAPRGERRVRRKPSL